MPLGRNANLGITVVFPSMKFNDAQKLPDKTLMRSIQTESMLYMHKSNFMFYICHEQVALLSQRGCAMLRVCQ